MEEEAAKCRQVFDPIENTFDYRKKRFEGKLQSDTAQTSTNIRRGIHGDKEENPYGQVQHLQGGKLQLVGRSAN